MKKFLSKCVLMILLAGSILWGAGWAYRQTNTYYNLEMEDNTLKFYNMPKEIGVAAFGSSHGRDAFQFTLKGRELFNFALSSQTPQYDEKLLLQYEKYLADDAIVFLTMSYFSPFYNDEGKSFENKQDRYYRILDAKNIVNVKLDKYVLQRFSPILTEDVTTVVAAFLQDTPKKENPQEKAKYNQAAPEMMDQEKKRIQKNHYTLIEPTYPEVNPVMWEAYRNMLIMCRERGWTAVIVTPPYLAEYSECFPDEFYPVFYEKVYALAEEFGVPYLDYSRDERFTTRYDLFKDIDHLNAVGAAILGEQIFADIKELGLLEVDLLLQG